MKVCLDHDLDDTQLEELVVLRNRMWEPVLRNEYPKLDGEELKHEVIGQFRSRIRVFPRGQRAALEEGSGHVRGGVSALLVNAMDGENRFDWDKVPATWNELTSRGSFASHDPEARLLTCCEIFGSGGVARPLLREETLLALRLSLEKVGVPESRTSRMGEDQLRAEAALLEEDEIVRVAAYTRPVGLKAWLSKRSGMGFNHQEIPPDKLKSLVWEYADLREPNHSSRLLDPNFGIHWHLGAELVRVIPEGRPADEDSCGVTGLMVYPPRHVIPAD
jgi:hypothetical protein